MMEVEQYIKVPINISVNIIYIDITSKRWYTDIVDIQYSDSRCHDINDII